MQPNNFGNEGGERVNRSVPRSYTEAFYAQFPYYLSIGMTEKQYWEGDNTLVIYYRKADEIKQDRQNQQAWLQGLYVYDAISRLSPILKAFPKKGTKAEPYVEEPYPLGKNKEEEAQRKKEEQATKKGIRYMEMIMAQNNKRFEEREEVSDNGNIRTT